MNRKPVKKLVVGKETLRQLEDPALRHAAGGTTYEYCTTISYCNYCMPMD